MLLGLWGAISFAISLPFDKQAVVTSSALFAVTVLFFGVGLGNLLLAFFRSRKKPLKLDFSKEWRTALFLPFVHGLASFLTYSSMSYALIAYNASVKRLWSFWAVVLSGKFLKEGNINRKLAATLIMLLGIAVTLVLG